MSPDPPGDGGSQSTVTAELRLVPQFSEKFLVRLGMVLIALFAVIAAVFCAVNARIGLLDESASGPSRLGTVTALLLGVLGTATLMSGVFLAAAELRRPPTADETTAPPVRTVVAETTASRGLADVIPGVVEKVGETFSKLKGAGAVLFTAVLLLGFATGIAWQSLPDKPCDLVTTTVETGQPPSTIVAATASCKIVNPAGTTAGK